MNNPLEVAARELKATAGERIAYVRSDGAFPDPDTATLQQWADRVVRVYLTARIEEMSDDRGLAWIKGKARTIGGVKSGNCALVPADLLLQALLPGPNQEEK